MGYEFPRQVPTRHVQMCRVPPPCATPNLTSWLSTTTFLVSSISSYLRIKSFPPGITQGLQAQVPSCLTHHLLLCPALLSSCNEQFVTEDPSLLSSDLPLISCYTSASTAEQSIRPPKSSQIPTVISRSWHPDLCWSLATS